MNNPFLDKFRADKAKDGYGPEDIEKMVGYLALSPAAYPVNHLLKRMDSICDGSYDAVEWPWAGLTSLAPSLTPGAVTVLVGGPGASKSFMVLQCINHWQKAGVKSCAYC